MKKRAMRCFAALLSVVMLCSQGITGIASPVSEEKEALTPFEQAFLNPDDDAKPFMRWWIAPGRMNEEEVRREIKEFADGGYSGVELQCLELAKDCVINDETWNETMKWILKAGRDYGVQIDFTIGQMWPIATPAISDIDDTRAEQQLFSASADFTASQDSMTYTADAYLLPRQLDANRDYEFIAVTAAKKLADGSYDPATAVDLLEEGQSASFDEATGRISWNAPSEGDWTVFYFYRQSAGHMVGFGVEQYVIDHMSEEATRAVTQNWEDAMNSDPELKQLYEENGGSLFGDSFELRSNLWTPNMLEEFKARRGYDLTPYLPAINSTFSEIGSRVRDDLYTTMTELLAENHMGVFNEWAESHNMTLRYQAYSSAGSSVFELTYPAMNTDIVEVESYAMSGTNPDAYRQLSAVPNMRGDKIFSAEAAEIGNDSWRETWTDTKLQSGGERRHLGFFYYANRLFAAGVNKMVFHGTTYKFTDTEHTYFPIKVTWPGYSAMSALSYGNEWDDKTPMWENVDIMTDALSRTQMVLQQGQGDVDLAMYRALYGKGNTRNSITPVEEAGYTYDYVTPSILEMDNAVVGTQDGKTVLAADGPSYKALVIEPLANGTPSEMPLETAEKILADAKAGLPVVIVGEVPSKVNSYPGSDEAVGSTDVLEDADAKLAEYMTELAGLTNVKTVADRAELVTALSELGVSPDAQPETSSHVYFNHRSTEDAQLYFIYNDGADTSSQSLTLKGTGIPYLLDPWSGEITPIAEYTSGNGTVTIDIDLESQDSMLVAVAKAGWSSKSPDISVKETNADAAVYDGETSSLALRSSQGGTLSAVLNDGTTVTVNAEAAEAPINLTDWTMVLNQWTQGETVHDTKVVPTDAYDLSETGLVPWYEIDPDNLKKAAGVAVYTSSFELEKGWAQGQGAYLDFSDISDVGRLFVNGTEVPMNQLSLRVDIGSYLTAGTNTIEVEVSSNMANVMFGTSPNNTYAFGIIGDVTLTPYTQTEVEIPQADTSILERVVRNAKEQIDSGVIATLIPSVQQSFTAAYDHAVDVLEHSNNQSEIDAAWVALMTEIHKLGFVAGDKTQLQELYDECDALDLSLYQDDEAMANFRAAMQSAKAVLDDQDALVQEVDDAYELLLAAVNSLVLKADKEQLRNAVQIASGYDKENYVQGSSWDAFEQALEAANAVLADDRATAYQIEDALNQLIDAMLNLRLRADKSLLAKIVADAKAIDLSRYTPASVAVFQEVLAQAEAMLDDETLGEQDEAAIKAMAAKVENAVQSLIQTGLAAPVQGDAGVTSSGSTPKTGDSLPVVGMTALLLAAAVLGLRRKKR